MKRRSKWVKVLVSVLLSVVLMVQMTGVAWGLYLNVPITSQESGEVCCWACAGTSVCLYYGVNISLDQFILSIKGTTSHYLPGTLDEIKGGLSMKGLSSQIRNSPLDYWGTCEEIDEYRPIVYLSYLKGSMVEDDYGQSIQTYDPHAIIVAGYTEDDTGYYAEYKIIDSFKTAPVYKTLASTQVLPQTEDDYMFDSCLYRIGL